MKKNLSLIIIGILVFSSLGAADAGTNQRQMSSSGNTPAQTMYEDELDQSMIDFDGALPAGRTNILGSYVNLSIAQSFIPQKELLTRAHFLMARNATTSYPFVLAVRQNLTGENLACSSVGPNEFPVVNGTPTEDQLAWIDFNFDDIWVTPGQIYYLVAYTRNTTDNFYWMSGNGTNMYLNGTVMLSVNDGMNWSELVNADGCFKTYGLRETFLSITPTGGIFGPSFVIKNIGNYTAWDITWNNTNSGGFILLGRNFIGTISELPPGSEITVKTGLIFGFGKITVSLRISAANVKETSSQATATIILFFIIGIR